MSPVPVVLSYSETIRGLRIPAALCPDCLGPMSPSQAVPDVLGNEGGCGTVAFRFSLMSASGL